MGENYQGFRVFQSWVGVNSDLAVRSQWVTKRSRVQLQQSPNSGEPPLSQMEVCKTFVAFAPKYQETEWISRVQQAFRQLRSLIPPSRSPRPIISIADHQCKTSEPFRSRSRYRRSTPGTVSGNSPADDLRPNLFSSSFIHSSRSRRHFSKISAKINSTA